MPTQMDMVQILANGGGLRIESAGKSQLDLVQLAANASKSAGLTILVNSRLTQMDMVQIAANGKGKVVFDFVSNG